MVLVMPLLVKLVFINWRFFGILLRVQPPTLNLANNFDIHALPFEFKPISSLYLVIAFDSWSFSSIGCFGFISPLVWWISIIYIWLEGGMIFYMNWDLRVYVLISILSFSVKTGPSVADAAVSRIAQGTKILAEGGYEKVFKQTFDCLPDEKLLKTYACYLSTSAGPVLGVMYLSTHKLAFSSDNPLSYKEGEQTLWSYYKVYSLSILWLLFLSNSFILYLFTSKKTIWEQRFSECNIWWWHDKALSELSHFQCIYLHRFIDYNKFSCHF